MKRDSLFYKIFQHNPTLLFDLLQTHPTNESAYRFDSVEVKETSFRIDGVFLPPDPSGIVYFAEVQFQPDDLLYERQLSEGAFYFYRNRDRCKDYRLVAIYPSAAVEQKDLEPHQFMIDTGKLIRIYLDRLGDINQLPIGLSLMVLTTLEEEPAKQVARELVDRAKTEPNSRAIMDMISDIIIYKFTNLSRDEVAAMLASNIQESRAYREIKAEGNVEGRQELVLLQARQKLKAELPELLIERIQQLPIAQLEALAVALFDFDTIEDLAHWLR